MDKKNIERPKKFNQNEYDRIYKKENYKSLSIRIKPDLYNIIDEYCNNNDVNKAQLIKASCLYIINNNIDISDINTD